MTKSTNNLIKELIHLKVKDLKYVLQVSMLVTQKDIWKQIFWTINFFCGVISKNAALKITFATPIFWAAIKKEIGNFTLEKTKSINFTYVNLIR